MTTPNLGLPELESHQSQPHLTVNSALRRIDALAQASCIAIQNTPPGSPVDGDRYIVGSAPTGEWVGHASDIAAYVGTGWVYFTPELGWLTYLESTALLQLYKVAGWTALYVGGVGSDTIWAAKGDIALGTANDLASRLGVGANGTVLTADSTDFRGASWQAPPGPGGDGAFYTCENLGAGVEPFASTDTGVDPRVHQFRSIVAGSNIDISMSGTEITVSYDGASGGGGGALLGARASKTPNQSIPNNTLTTLTFETEVQDDGAFWDAGDTTRLTATEAGWYSMVAAVQWSSAISTAGLRQVVLRFHDFSAAGATTDIASVTQPHVLSVATTQGVDAIFYMDVDDWITVEVLQTNTGALNSDVNANTTHFSWLKHP
jgi:hypothetical protein